MINPFSILFCVAGMFLLFYYKNVEAGLFFLVVGIAIGLLKK